MSNNNYITIQLSFLSYILFVFTRFEAFVRNAILDVFAVAIRLFRNIFGRAFFKPFFLFLSLSCFIYRPSPIIRCLCRTLENVVKQKTYTDVYVFCCGNRHLHILPGRVLVTLHPFFLSYKTIRSDNKAFCYFLH